MLIAAHECRATTWVREIAFYAPKRRISYLTYTVTKTIPKIIFITRNFDPTPEPYLITLHIASTSSRNKTIKFRPIIPQKSWTLNILKCLSKCYTNERSGSSYVTSSLAASLKAASFRRQLNPNNNRTTTRTTETPPKHVKTLYRQRPAPQPRLHNESKLIRTPRVFRGARAGYISNAERARRSGEYLDCRAVSCSTRTSRKLWKLLMLYLERAWGTSRRGGFACFCGFVRYRCSVSLRILCGVRGEMTHSRMSVNDNLKLKLHG